MPEQSIFAEPEVVNDIGECFFYHTMELPGHGLVRGDWDLRNGVEQYWGGIDLRNKRVLEVGPASGFLTFEMERRGAAVVCVDLDAKVKWDFAPYPRDVIEKGQAEMSDTIPKIKKAFWFAHAAHQSKARVHYGDAYNLPDALGRFDVAFLADMLLHTRDPLRILEQCARFTDKIIITELYRPELDFDPIMRLIPAPDNASFAIGAWWYFSPKLFENFLGILGFTDCNVSHHSHLLNGQTAIHFTIEATRK